MQACVFVGIAYVDVGLDEAFATMVAFVPLRAGTDEATPIVPRKMLAPVDDDLALKEDARDVPFASANVVAIFAKLPLTEVVVL